MNKLKDIVPIQQERDLKELGFNFENEHCYLKEKLSLFKVEEPYDTFDLILFSQAFRWFREKHGHAGFIELIEPEYGGDYGYAIYYKLNHLSVDHWNKGFKTYEEAELACLDKLIEIVKTK
jgi:hypothetical protein